MSVQRLPSWLRQGLTNSLCLRTQKILLANGVSTVCQQAGCPNINDCFARREVAFMLLGKRCTRNCAFCRVEINSRLELGIDADEPRRISEAVKLLGLKYVVITSVTRDDLVDGGAGQFVKVIELLREADQDIKVEVLIPDFQGNSESLKKLVQSEPFVLGHNLETVKRLYGAIRPEADYQRSLNLLRIAKEFSSSLVTKSSLMLGLGETEEEVVAALKDMRLARCDMVTLGQYLAPSALHYPVKEFILPERFEKYAEIGMRLGFKKVFSSPKARSSYRAEELTKEFTLCAI